MRILLIGNTETNDDPETYFGQYVEFMRGAAKDLSDVAVEYTFFSDLHVSVGDGEFVIYDCRHSQDIAEYDVVLLRGGGYRKYYDLIKAISVYCVEHDIRVVNDYQHFRDSSKLTQAVQFHQLGLPVACSVYVTDAVLQAKHPLGFEFPCVMKATFGSHGDDNYLVKSMEEAADIVGRFPVKKFVLQRFVANEGDYRILIIGDELAVIKRKSTSGSHLNNTSQGGSAELVETASLPAEIIEFSRKIAKHLDMVFAGVDVLADMHTGEYYFLEVNAQPQLMTGAYLDVKSEMLGKYFKQVQDAKQ